MFSAYQPLPFPAPPWPTEMMKVGFTTLVWLVLNKISTDVIDREIRNIHSAVESCRGARIMVYEGIERRSIQYNTKARKEVTSIVRFNTYNPFKTLNP